MSTLLHRLVLLVALLFGAIVPGHAHAAQLALVQSRTLARGSVEKAVAQYAKKRGFRPDRMSVKILGLTESGKSTRAVVTWNGKETQLVVNHGTGRVQARDVASLTSMLLDAHTPMKRAATGDASSFASMLVDFQPGKGASLGGKALGRGAPLGRPRAGQSVAAQALDTLSLGSGGAVTVAFGKDLVAGRPGAGVRVRENGFADATGTIINQTPGLVEVMVGTTWHRLGYAGYKAAGDTLLLSNAIDPIPAGSAVSVVRVTDAPNGPHPHGVDPTDNAVAAARGVKGFDLVSVEAL